MTPAFRILTRQARLLNGLYLRQNWGKKTIQRLMKNRLCITEWDKIWLPTWTRVPYTTPFFWPEMRLAQPPSDMDSSNPGKSALSGSRKTTTNRSSVTQITLFGPVSPGISWIPRKFLCMISSTGPNCHKCCKMWLTDAKKILWWWEPKGRLRTTAS